MQLIDIAGQIFDRLTVIRREPGFLSGCVWRAQCVCGSAPKLYRGADLRRGFVRSCGCYNKEKLKARATHGKSNTREFRIWVNMLTRCTNKKAPQYAQYGARGVRVCRRWRSFENFLADMGSAPTLQHSVDRVDGTKGYAPENCRWATPREQAQNQITNRKIVWRGELLCLTEVARRVAIPRERLRTRLDSDWSVEDAITTPARARLLTHKGETDALASWARRVGLSNSGLRKRLLLGWPIERALSEGVHR